MEEKSSKRNEKFLLYQLIVKIEISKNGEKKKEKNRLNGKFLCHF